MRNVWSVLISSVASMLLVGCSLLQVFPSPVPGTAAPDYGGDDAATLHLRVEHTDCCYIEGDLDVMQLDGPTSREWSVDEESDAHVAPGDYTLTAFEQVCGGNCGNLSAPTHHCSLDLSLSEGESVDLVITFPVPGPCTVEVQGGS